MNSTIQTDGAKMDLKIESSSVITVSSSQLKVSRVPLSIFDRFANNIHIAVLYAFVGPTAPNAAVKAGLAEALVYFPTLAGTFGEDDHHHGRPCNHIGDGGAGALLVEATVASDLSDYLPLEPFREMSRLHPAVEPAPVHLLQVQLNRFRCGGLVVGVTAHHRVADGQSMAAFVAAWGRAVRGLDPDPVPIIDDRPWLTPRDPPRCEFDHWLNEFTPNAQPPPPEDDIEPDNMINITVHYSRHFINTKLKSSSSSTVDEPWRYTTFETLLGHVWRKITIARGLPREEVTSARISVNGRQRLRPAVPPEFFGNMVLYAYPRATAGELVDGGHAVAASLIHDAVAKTDESFFRSFIDFGELHGGEKELVPSYDLEGMVLCPDVEVDSWLGFCFNEIDFGSAEEGGEGAAAACTVTTSWIPVEGVIVLKLATPAPGERVGGVDVIVTLFEEHEKLFRQISHTLD